MLSICKLQLLKKEPLLNVNGGETMGSERPPKMSFIIQSYDTAFMKKETADYSAITTWGVFHREDNGQNAILLDAFKGRYEFPELRRRAHEEYSTLEPRRCYNRTKGIRNSSTS